MNRTSAVAALVLLTAGWLLSGCGGGGNSSGLSSNRGAAAFTIRWPASSTSQVQPALVPEAVRSVTVALTQDGVLVAPAQTVTRTAGGPATAEVRFDDLMPGIVTATATAYPNPDGTGTPLAKGTVLVEVVPGTEARGKLVLDSTIARLELAPSPVNVAAGATQQLTATAKDSDGNVVLLSPSALDWTPSPGSLAAVDDNGLLTGVAVGQAQVTVTDTESGKSASADVNVAFLGPGTVSGAVAIAPGASVGAAANVALVGATVTTSDGVHLYTTTTGPDGTFILENVPGGTRVVSVSAAGYLTQNRLVVMAGSALVLNAQLTLNPAPSPAAPPAITLNDAVVDAAAGLATISGTISDLDCTTAAAVQNGDEALLPVPDGTFTQQVVLQPGANRLQVRATNAAGSTISRTLEINHTGDFYFRVSLTWDRLTDADLHVWSPTNQHCFFANLNIVSGFLDGDNTAAMGPESFTCTALQEGLFRVAANYYGGTPAVNCVLRVLTGSKAPNIVNELSGPHALTVSNNGEGYPVTGDTASWWRPCDVRLGSDGAVSVLAADTSVALTDPTIPASARAAAKARRH